MALENAAAPVFDRLGAASHTLAQAYRHVPTGKRYSVMLEAGGMVELSPLCGPSEYVSLQRLADAHIWQRIN